MSVSFTRIVNLVSGPLRTYATLIRDPPKRPRLDSEPEGPLRPHLNVPVNSSHGLYGFFRKRTENNSYKKAEEGSPVDYIAIERPVEVSSGRAWQSAELRRKSFKDLHTLWYILLRERNLIQTQRLELRRIGAPRLSFLKHRYNDCKMGMARIKHLLSERRAAYMEAAPLRRLVVRHPERYAKLVEEKAQNTKSRRRVANKIASGNAGESQSAPVEMKEPSFLEVPS
ncbi:MRP-L47-domain-containing protein [Hysterangium stoloniferum]|nr:MRP-L47-domain-containing protein [Hysterangium stoloniferum]